MSYAEKSKAETEATMERIKLAVSRGMTPETAVNQNAHTAESYSAALKAYGLTPVIPD